MTILNPKITFKLYLTPYFSVEGKSWLSKKWKLCSPLSENSDVTVLKNWVSELLVNLAMVNYPYPANFLAPLPGNPIKVIIHLLKHICHLNNINYFSINNLVLKFTLGIL